MRKWESAERWSLLALDNHDDDRIEEDHFSNAEVCWIMLKSLRGETLDVDILLSKLDQYIKVHLEAFAKRHSLGKVAENKYVSLVTIAIARCDHQVVFMALSRSRAKQIISDSTPQASWLLAALNSQSLTMMQLLFVNGIDVNTKYTYTPRYIPPPALMLRQLFSTEQARAPRFLQSIEVTILAIAISQSGSNKNMEEIALLCLQQQGREVGFELTNHVPMRQQPEGTSTRITALHLAAYARNLPTTKALLHGWKHESATVIYDNGGGLQHKIKLKTLKHTAADIARLVGARRILQLLSEASIFRIGSLRIGSLEGEALNVCRAVYGPIDVKNVW